MTSVNHLNMANAIRALSMDCVETAKSGHPGMPMGMADVATVLFTKFLKFNAVEPNWPDRDRFILSAGHGSMLLYSLLHLTGYVDMSMDELKKFRKLGAKTAGHPEYGYAGGIETTTGPLGQGLGNAVGFALAERMLAARHGDDLVNHNTYGIVGDGCLMEGISHEAISMAGHLKLSKLIIFWDNNSITIDGATDISVSDNQHMRFAASGWDVFSCDGHDAGDIEKAIIAAQKSDKPSLIDCKTIIGYGAPSKQGTSKIHGAPLGTDEIIAAKKALNWPHDAYIIPDDIAAKWRLAGIRSVDQYNEWQSRHDNIDAGKRDIFDRGQQGRLPDGWEDAINAFKKQTSLDMPKLATRMSSQKTLDVLYAAIPEMVGGSADLTGSNNTKAVGMDAVTPDNYGGSYIYYGVREHGMAAAMNGIALHGGLIPYGATFMVFTDYCRPSMRLSALMHQRVIYVMTHDSIGLGEDGPTHQPVEHLAAMRAMPNMLVLRPCDTVETAEAWAVALKNDKGPSMLALTRQGLPLLRVKHEQENMTARGGYIMADSDGECQAVILASGSEVEIAINARDILQKDGIPTRVVSMVCHELFDAQDTIYKKNILGNGSVFVAVEAGIQQGWDKYIGIDGGFVGMDSFGASAPINDLYNHFGITALNVASAVKSRL